MHAFLYASIHLPVELFIHAFHKYSVCACFVSDISARVLVAPHDECWETVSSRLRAWWKDLFSSYAVQKVNVHWCSSTVVSFPCYWLHFPVRVPSLGCTVGSMLVLKNYVSAASTTLFSGTMVYF